MQIVTTHLTLDRPPRDIDSPKLLNSPHDCIDDNRVSAHGDDSFVQDLLLSEPDLLADRDACELGDHLVRQDGNTRFGILDLGQRLDPELLCK